MAAKRRIIPFFIPHAGCKHACVFCNQNRISGVAASACLTGDDLRKLLTSGGRSAGRLDTDPAPADIAFYGGSFTALPVEQQNELLEGAQPFLGLNSQNAIRVSTRPDCVDEADVLRLVRYGVATVELGAQSMSDEVLLRSRRGHTSFDVARAAEIIKGAGLKLILQMMTGLPGDTNEGAIYTAKRFIELNPDGVRIYPTVVIKGTTLYEMWRRGEYKAHTVDDAVDLCTELIELFQKAKIPIIRLGLNPTDALTAGDAAAGAYHPAFGELAYSQVYFNKAAAILKGFPPGGAVTITVAKGRVSMMAGRHRQNIRRLTEYFSVKSIKVVEADIPPGEINIEINQ